MAKTEKPGSSGHAVRIGCAGWSLPRRHAHRFEETGSHLERYARAFECVEVNSSFHRPHRRSVWERWAASVPDEFRFAVKAPKSATHVSKLVNCGAILQEFFTQIGGLGNKLGPVLVQLPPSLAFEEGVARDFLGALRELHAGAVVLEPRHASWFTVPANRLLVEFEIARVAADPAPRRAEDIAAAIEPGGWKDLRYWRLHGSPRVYWSGYDADFLASIAARVHQQREKAETWVIFDNTAMGEATRNALELMAMVHLPGNTTK